MIEAIVCRDVGEVVAVYHKMISGMHMATLGNLQVPDCRRKWLDTPQSLLGRVMPGNPKDASFHLRNSALQKPAGNVVGLVELERENVQL
jgi:hypothetical protein